jgi:hypothetical protein
MARRPIQRPNESLQLTWPVGINVHARRRRRAGELVPRPRASATQLNSGVRPHRPASVSERTVSETLFEALCSEHGISCEEIPSGPLHRTADYRVTLTGGTVVVEIKQLDPGPEDARIARELAERGKASGCFAPGQRVRREIKSGYGQLRREAADKYPALLVLYDNTGGLTGHITAHDVLVAMYGEEYLVAYVARPPELDIVALRTGGKRGVTADSNRALSAIGVLRGWLGFVSLEVYHNRFATHPLDTASLWGARISHFQVAPSRDGQFLEWRVIDEHAV